MSINLSVGRKQRALADDVVSMLPRWLVDFMMAHPMKCYVAGGFVRDVLDRKKPKDIDLFFADKETYVEAAGQIYNQKMRSWFSVAQSRTTTTFVGWKGDKAVTSIQMVSFRFFPTPEECILSFDFTCCMACVSYDNGKWQLTSHPRFVWSVQDKTLAYVPMDRHVMMQDRLCIVPSKMGVHRVLEHATRLIRKGYKFTAPFARDWVSDLMRLYQGASRRDDKFLQYLFWSATDRSIGDPDYSVTEEEEYDETEGGGVLPLSEGPGEPIEFRSTGWRFSAAEEPRELDINFASVLYRTTDPV